ncbi:hypothetical protein ACJQWK_05186 [Exserohilum turcicum]|uniref:Xylanolytic transcriptional activator regulatory domain-containing protein n=1 Tax=Exserohilum turcicum (strain 28A) TaxID=671987 RepID=R0I8C9_EXST2|nr:uncharacterized protein SETTUDRAFT_23041 [Exserohilum turcica Et28A]EOA81785.1 hypothetical protein SETTUDRAFT_23041 [Exserohilum turcica Et28A]
MSNPASISYIESLKARVRDLEAQSNDASDTSRNGLDAEHSSPHHQNGSLFEHDTPHGPSPGDGVTAVETRSGSNLQDAMHEASYLSLSAMAEPTDGQSLSNQGLSFRALFLATTSLGGTNPSLPIGTNTSLCGSMADFRNQVFSHGSGLDAVQIAAAFRTFLEMAPTCFPLMTPRELEEYYDSVNVSEHNGDAEHMMEESPEKIVIVSIGAALGLLLSPNYSFTEVLVSELATRAFRLMSRVFDQSGDLAVVQCLATLSIYSLYTTYGGSSWHLLGLAMTRCISSGMHTSRVSDVNLDGHVKRKTSRVFWTLYILDTHLSTALDRPFCLNDGDIMISPPSSPQNAELDDNEAALRHLVRHAQILRSIRKQTEDSLCHFVNLSHWRETAPAVLSSASLLKDQLYARGLIELLKCPRFATDPGRSMMDKHIEDEFAQYAARIEDQLTNQQLAPGALEGYLVFAIGIFAVSQAPNELRQTCVLQCLSSLTLLSARYTAFRGFRAILVALRSGLATREHLEKLVDDSTITVSPQLQWLVFGGLRADQSNVDQRAPWLG